MEIRDALEQSLDELEIDNLNGSPEGTPFGTVETKQEPEPEGGEQDSDSVVDEVVEEETSEAPEESSGELVLEVQPGSQLKLPDGTLVDADNAVLMQADYTRKTQELAEQRKAIEGEYQQLQVDAMRIQDMRSQMNDWYQERASKPSNWVSEIVAESSDPTATLSKAIIQLSEAGYLDPQFVQTFGLESGPVVERAKTAEIQDEIQELRSWKNQQEQYAEYLRQQEFYGSAIQQQTNAYEQQWEDVKAEKGLVFENKVDELDAKRKVLEFALNNRITNSLADAYDLMSVRVPSAPKRENNTDIHNKKRASRAVTPKSASSGASVNIKRNVSDREAILAAMEEISF